MSSPNIVQVGYGLASNYGDTIEINRKVVGNLKDKIMKHELKHGRNRAYSRKDIKTDFQSKDPYFFESLKLAIKNPEMIIGFFPSMYSYYFKEWTWNWSALIPFAVLGGIFSLFWWLIFKINPLQSFICWGVIVSIMNLILLGLTHQIVKTSGYDY